MFCCNVVVVQLHDNHTEEFPVFTNIVSFVYASVMHVYMHV